MSRCTISSSAIAGQPGRPRWLQHEPSCMTAPLVSEATSQCWASVMPSGSGVLQRAAHQLRVLHAVAVVGEQVHAGRGQLAERRQLLAVAVRW